MDPFSILLGVTIVVLLLGTFLYIRREILDARKEELKQKDTDTKETLVLPYNDDWRC